MSAMIEMRTINGVEVASFAENGRKERAWHELGQVVNEPMFVADALKLCHADYKVQMQPIAALSDEIVEAVKNKTFINAAILEELIVKDSMATVRTDTNSALGLVSNRYGIVQNEDAFKFVDMFCSGQMAERDNTPVIETCGVLGHGERVFVTAKFPQPIIMDAKRDDLVEMYVVFTTSHDGTGAVSCMCTPIRVVCNNTLSLAMHNNIGRISFRHSSGVMNRINLLNEENAKFAYQTLNLAEVYTNGLRESFEQLRKIQLSERNIENIIAETTLSTEAFKVFMDTRNIFSQDIPTRGRNIYLNVRECLESGVGQEGQEKGNAMWLINGLTSYYQNEANFKDSEVKFDSIMSGNTYNKVNNAYQLCLKAA